MTEADARRAEPPQADSRERVQCSNCCQLAPITGRGLGLLFYECELCGTRGTASPDERVQLPPADEE
jgi:hypothetical protein